MIVPTRALRERGDLLREALRSIVTQEGVTVHPIVVVNGPEADPVLVRNIGAAPRCTVIVQPEADLPGAYRAGRAAVATPWFATLDDDDVLLPGALTTRVTALEHHPDRAVVVTNGFRQREDGRIVHVKDGDAVRRDPGKALLAGNWLLPGSWLAHTARIGPELFEPMPRYLECTYLAVRFATSYPMIFLDQPTLVWRENAPRRVSDSKEFFLGQVAALRRILEFPMPASVRRGFQRKLTDSMHERATRSYWDGLRSDAWSWYFRTVFRPGGARYLGFAWRLLLPKANR